MLKLTHIRHIIESWYLMTIHRWLLYMDWCLRLTLWYILRSWRLFMRSGMRKGWFMRRFRILSISALVLLFRGMMLSRIVLHVEHTWCKLLLIFLALYIRYSLQSLLPLIAILLHLTNILFTKILQPNSSIWLLYRLLLTIRCLYCFLVLHREEGLAWALWSTSASSINLFGLWNFFFFYLIWWLYVSRYSEIEATLDVVIWLSGCRLIVRDSGVMWVIRSVTFAI